MGGVDEQKFLFQLDQDVIIEYEVMLRNIDFCKVIPSEMSPLLVYYYRSRDVSPLPRTMILMGFRVGNAVSIWERSACQRRLEGF